MKDDGKLEKYLEEEPNLYSLLSDPRVTEESATNMVMALFGARIETKKLYEEIQRIVGESTNLTKEHLARMSYLKAWVKESLRRTFPLSCGTGRYLETDLEVGGYEIPKDTFVVVNGALMCRDERFFPRPTEYLPERWLRDAEGELTISRNFPFAYNPFGNVPRSCLGQRFAETEIFIAVTKYRMSSVIVPTLKDLAFTEEEDEILLLLSDFIGFLRSKREDGDQSISPDNLKVELSKRNLLRTSNDQFYVTFQESATDFQTFNDHATLLRSNMHKKYGVVPEIIFMEENTLSTYNCKNCSLSAVHEFHVRDDYFSKKFGDKVLYVSRALEKSYTDIFTLDTIDCNDFIYCEHCFRSIAGYIDRPLNWRQFDLLKEWYVEVPLEFQIILGSLFINKESFRRSDKGDSYLYSKIGRLYALLDSGLNILNRNYNGIVQQLNTEELFFNYHSISTVISVTGQSGTTRSLKSASRWLQSLADVDKRYYETLLKKYPLQYTTINDELSTRQVCMRDCHAILYLDNLVRLGVHADPDPGKNRTSQICTLPITIKGLPKDSWIVETWHDKDCTGGNDCQCFERKQLDKDDHNLFFNCTKDEQIALYKLNIQTSFGTAI
ncbi:unnamed protein product [Mytilus coruscus]|uniref:Unspecific monooxygenase n=1 Tax=Mytilus coruscus TaxID=42192 RepID=A0A6J8D667_MYTCO|nr:unnamed protein product [Mytilus coruscus]